MGPRSDPRWSSPLCCRNCRQLWREKKRVCSVSCEGSSTRPAHRRGQAVTASRLTPGHVSALLSFYSQILLFFLLSSAPKILLPLLALAGEHLVWSGGYLTPLSTSTVRARGPSSEMPIFKQ